MEKGDSGRNRGNIWTKMAECFPRVMTDPKPQIKEAQSRCISINAPPKSKNKKNHMHNIFKLLR